MRQAIATEFADGVYRHRQCEIRRTVADYAHAARDATQAGFDGVQILVNYLLVQFLNRTTHRPTDEYGVGIENRTRILFVVEAVLGEVDRSLVGMKISSTHEGDLVAAHDETRLATYFD